MNGSKADFNNLMAEAHRAIVVLDGFTKRDGPKAASAAVIDCQRVYQDLLDYQRVAYMTGLESHALQEMADMLRARLRFFGESV